MEVQQHRKWVLLSYIAVAALIYYIVFTASFWASGRFDLEARVANIELILRLASIGLGAVVFLVLYLNQTINQFMFEVVDELAKVTWPTQSETVSATIVVLIMVLISGLVLGAFDYLWTVMVQWIV